MDIFNPDFRRRFTESVCKVSLSDGRFGIGLIQDTVIPSPGDVYAGGEYEFSRAVRSISFKEAIITTPV